MFAIVRTGGKQLKVEKDSVIRVEKLDVKKGDKIDLDDVLLVDDGKKRTLGAPTVKGASVKAEVVEQERDKKVTIFKKKKRQNYRRTKGHRQPKTVLKVTDIKAA